MFANRIKSWNILERQPKPAAPVGMSPNAPAGFVVAPMCLIGAPVAWQMHVYQLAYQRARVATELPRHHRRLAVWN